MSKGGGFCSVFGIFQILGSESKGGGGSHQDGTSRGLQVPKMGRPKSFIFRMVYMGFSKFPSLFRPPFSRKTLVFLSVLRFRAIYKSHIFPDLLIFPRVLKVFLRFLASGCDPVSPPTGLQPAPKGKGFFAPFRSFQILSPESKGFSLRVFLLAYRW